MVTHPKVVWWLQVGLENKQPSSSFSKINKQIFRLLIFYKLSRFLDDEICDIYNKISEKGEKRANALCWSCSLRLKKDSVYIFGQLYPEITDNSFSIKPSIPEKMSLCSVSALAGSDPKVPIFSRAVISVSFSAMRLMRLARRLFCLTVSSTRLSSTFSARPERTSATDESPVNLMRLASRRFSSLSFLTMASANPVLKGSSS